MAIGEKNKKTMAFVTKLLIEQREIEVISYQFGFKKNTEEQNKPISSTSFNGLEIEIESTENTYFEEWMNSEKSKEKIELQIFYPYLEGGSKIMTFFDCYLIGFKTDFSSNNTEPMKDRLRITCGGVKAPYSQIEYSTSWRKTLSPKNEYKSTTPIVEYKQDGTKKLLDYFITDTNDGIIDNYKENDIIFLNIKTKNRVGDFLTLNIKDADYDFEYNGKVLSDDILKDIKIVNDLMKVKLKVVKPKK